MPAVRSIIMRDAGGARAVNTIGIAAREARAARAMLTDSIAVPTSATRDLSRERRALRKQ